MKRLTERLLETSVPVFGQCTIWLLMLFAIILAALPPCHEIGVRSDEPATLLAFLPDSLIRSLVFYHVLRVFLLVGAVIWATGRELRVSPWVTTLSFTAVWALRMENVANGAHIFHATNMLLYVHLAWMVFYGKDISEAKKARKFWSSPLYPRWVFGLCVFYLGLFHTWAGITKIQHSGFDWGNGLSLQLWIYLWGWPASPFGQLVLSSRWIAASLQTGALIIESGSFLCWFGKWPRLIIGLALLGFYSGVLGTFVDFGFHFNAILVAWFLLPVEPWLTRWATARFNLASESSLSCDAPMKPSVSS